MTPTEELSPQHHRLKLKKKTNILQKLKPNIAPGLNQLSVNALKALHQHHPAVLPQLSTVCLSMDYFSQCWRKGRATIVPKPGKDPAQLGSYRPLTMLSHLGKIQERVIASRLVEHYKAYNPLDNRQYGFWKGIGTEQAIHKALKMYKEHKEYLFTAAVSLDIQGAFDHADWPTIQNCLKQAAAPHFLVCSITTYFKG